ncbi:unnamed protein product [Symbiodinium sp. CCMP2592]|nr:unnamed protein product [Symbiodinium sp. CCMP2592]
MAGCSERRCTCLQCGEISENYGATPCYSHVCKKCVFVPQPPLPPVRRNMQLPKQHSLLPLLRPSLRCLDRALHHLVGAWSLLPGFWQAELSCPVPLMSPALIPRPMLSERTPWLRSLRAFAAGVVGGRRHLMLVSDPGLRCFELAAFAGALVALAAPVWHALAPAVCALPPRQALQGIEAPGAVRLRTALAFAPLAALQSTICLAVFSILIE